MDHYKKYRRQITGYLLKLTLVWAFIVAGLFVSLIYFTNLQDKFVYAAVGATMLSGAVLVTLLATKASFEALGMLRQAILHISKDSNDIPPPKLESVRFGKEMVMALAKQVYDLGSSVTINAKTTKSDANKNAPQQPDLAAVTAAMANDVLDKMPMPVLVISPKGQVMAINENAKEYLKTKEITGQNLAEVLNFSFHGKDTLEAWVAEVRDKRATAQNSWQRVRYQLPDDKGLLQFDLAAFYSKDNPKGYEMIVALYDQTSRYSKEDDDAAYVALAVHELRTPLTVLRGYIEVFEDELNDKLPPEYNDFMHKMSASAQQLSAFVNNILNVARVEENQLTLHLVEENWNTLLPEICQDMELRARVRGKTLKYEIEPNLPTVAVDRVSIYETVGNLVDNAIKYGPNAKEIIIRARKNKQGMIDTSVEDFGIGVPSSGMKHLFTKFYRNHRSRGQIGGTGLGLYLVKAIVTAHNGEVWVNSKEGRGSTFGFTLQTYANAGSQVDKNGEIARQAHGWIKNHSLYRG